MTVVNRLHSFAVSPLKHAVKRYVTAQHITAYFLTAGVGKSSTHIMTTDCSDRLMAFCTYFTLQ